MRDWQIRRRSPYGYSPAADSALDIWLDATDTATTSLQNTSGGAITDGATVGQWNSKKVARSFQQFLSNARPTWAAAGWMGLPAVRFNSQILKATTSAGYAALSGITVMFAGFLVAPVAGNGCAVGITVPHETGGADTSMVFAALNGTATGGGGRRRQADAFAAVGTGAFANNTATVNTLVLGFVAKTGSAYFNGVENVVNIPFQAGGSGTTAASPDPFGIAVGGFAQESAGSNGLPINGYLGEVLIWKSDLTPDQLVPAHDYLRRRWGAGAM